MMQCQTPGCNGLSGAICTGAGQWIQFCPICKTKQAIQPPRQPDAADGLAVRALVDLQRANYAAAEKGFLDAAAKTAQDAPRQAFYLWCSLIARYGVEYVHEILYPNIPARRANLFVPTFGRFPLPDHRIMETEACRQLDMLLFGMPGVDVGSHLRELDILIQEIGDCMSDRKNQYNVFIAWHDRTDDGHGPCRTFADRLNSYLNAQRDCYSFVSFRSLRDVIVDHYEPHIYTALASAKVMVIVVDDLDAMQRKFLRSEINRFLIRRAANHKLHIYLCCMQGATGTPPTMMAGWQRRNGCENTEVWYELVTKDVMERLRDDAPAPKPEPVQPKPPKPEPVPQPVPKPEPDPQPVQPPKKESVQPESVPASESEPKKEETEKKKTQKEHPVLRKTAVISLIVGIMLVLGVVLGCFVAPAWIESNKPEATAEPTATSTLTPSPTHTPLPEDFVYQDFTISRQEDGLVITDYSGDDTTIKIPEQINGIPVVAIGDKAFYDCANLTNITIPEGVAHIGNYAFSECHNLTSITIPNSITSISMDEGYIFLGCSRLKTINISPDHPVFTLISGALYDHTQHKLLIYPSGRSEKEYQIPQGTLSIGKNAFRGCSNLTRIVIPESVTSIGTHAFYDCENLTSINLPTGITFIAAHTFDGCTSLTALTIPEGITSVDGWAFCGCCNLTITLPKSVISISDVAFIYSDNITLYVTAGSYAETYAREYGLRYKRY